MPNSDVVFTVRSMPVRDPFLRGGQLMVDVNVCVACGSVVFDVLLHDRFHKTWHRK